MKKVFVLLLSLLMMSLVTANVFADDENVVNMNIAISDAGDGNMYVTFPKEDLFKETEPTMSVDVGEGYDDAVVYRPDHTKALNCSYADGVISFTVDVGGQYYIGKDGKDVPHTDPVPSDTGYVPPRTGIR